MLLLIDIGNTHTHVALSSGEKILRHADIRTSGWQTRRAVQELRTFIPEREVRGAVFCSVVPDATKQAESWLRRRFSDAVLELTHETLTGVGINYPKPKSIGPDRLANALAVHARFGAPSLVVDFGTAVTFDVVDRAGNYVGGIIAPGLSAMTDYLHEKTALLPRIKIREISKAIGKSTEEAMLIGAVHGYRGLIRELITQLKKELGVRKLPVVATGGCAELIASKMPEVTAIDPFLTLQGLRLLWESHVARNNGLAHNLKAPKKRKMRD